MSPTTERDADAAVQRHELKTWPEFFALMLADEKPFEVRRNDRHFELGDTLVLQEWEPFEKRYTGRSVERRVTSILHGSMFGLGPEYVVMGLSSLRAPGDSATTSPSADPYYLPMDCPVCGRSRMEWDGHVLRCEKCTTSSEWDGFTKERYRAQGDSATSEPTGCTVHEWCYEPDGHAGPHKPLKGDSATPHIHPGEFHPDCALCVGAVKAFQGDSATSALLPETVRSFASLPYNWDSYGAHAPGEMVVGRAERLAILLTRLQPVPGSDGCIAFEAHEGGDSLVLSIEADGSPGLYVSLGDYEFEYPALLADVPDADETKTQDRDAEHLSKPWDPERCWVNCPHSRDADEGAGS